VFKGYDYTRNLELQMTGKEWHQHAKVDYFRIAPDRDNRDATGNHNEVWGVK
jgi:hypothetical protein